MVGDHTVGREISQHLVFAVPRQLADSRQSALEKVDLVVRVDALQNSDDALKAHPCVHVGGRQRFERVGSQTVVLDENQIPQLDEAVGVERLDGHFALFGAQVDVDLGARSAGTRIRHLPEIILAPEVEKMPIAKARLLDPVPSRFFV